MYGVAGDLVAGGEERLGAAAHPAQRGPGLGEVGAFGVEFGIEVGGGIIRGTSGSVDVTWAARLSRIGGTGCARRGDAAHEPTSLASGRVHRRISTAGSFRLEAGLHWIAGSTAHPCLPAGRA